MPILRSMLYDYRKKLMPLDKKDCDPLVRGHGGSLEKSRNDG